MTASKPFKLKAVALALLQYSLKIICTVLHVIEQNSLAPRFYSALSVYSLNLVKSTLNFEQNRKKFIDF